MTKGPVLRWCCTELQPNGGWCPQWNLWPDCKRTIGLSVDGFSDRTTTESIFRREIEAGEYWTDQHGVRRHANVNGVRFLIHRVPEAFSVTTALNPMMWSAMYAGHVDPDTWIEIQPRYEEHEQAAEAVS